MNAAEVTKISALLKKNEESIGADWLKDLSGPNIFRSAAPREDEMRERVRHVLQSMIKGGQQAASAEVTQTGWEDLREHLEASSRALAREGFTPAETVGFVLSLKRVIFSRVTSELKSTPAEMAAQVLNVSDLVDNMALFTTAVYQKGREEVILRQQQEMMELSTPVVELSKGILALPLIGTLDSERTQVVMENLLEKIVSTGAPIAIIDITGVPTVDTLVAQHLLKTIAAARLMGADCIISGIRPQIAQTIVHLGVALGDVTTKATLADAFAVALKRTGMAIARIGTTA